MGQDNDHGQNSVDICRLNNFALRHSADDVLYQGEGDERHLIFTCAVSQRAPHCYDSIWTHRTSLWSVHAPKCLKVRLLPSLQRASMYCSVKVLCLCSPRGWIMFSLSLSLSCVRHNNQECQYGCTNYRTGPDHFGSSHREILRASEAEEGEREMETGR